MLATWDGGSLSVQEVADALGHRAPLFDYALLNPNAEKEYREDFVDMLGRAKQLDALAVSRGANQPTRLARLRTLPELHVTQGTERELSDTIDRMTSKVSIVDHAALETLSPTRFPFVAKHEPERAIVVPGTANGVFRETCLADGSRVLDLDLAGAQSGPLVMSPGMLLALELLPGVEDFADDRNEVMHGPWAVSYQGRITFPLPPPFGNGTLVLDSVQVEGLREDEARLAWSRIEVAMTRCLAMAAWGNRWDLSHVAIRAWVKEGRMNASAPVFDVVTTHGSLPNGAMGVAMRIDRAEYCSFVLSRWLFPSNASGNALFHATLTVKGFEDDQLQ